jgi:HK97 family phage major capsid protein
MSDINGRDETNSTDTVYLSELPGKVIEFPGAVKLIKRDEESSIVTIGGYGVLFGGKDLYNQTFLPITEYMLDLVPVKLVTYDHTLQAEIPDPIGETVKEYIDEVGIWVEAQLDANREYVKEVIKLIEKGVLAWSSGSISHLVQLSGDIIKRWPIVEYALTPTPAEPRLLAEERINFLSLSNPGLKAYLSEIAGDPTIDKDATDGGRTNTKGLEVTKMSEDKEIGTEEVQEEEELQAPEVNYKEIVAGVVEALVPEIQESVKSTVDAEIKALFDEDPERPNFLMPKNIKSKSHMGDPDPVTDFYDWVRTGRGQILKHVNHEAEIRQPDGTFVKAALQEGTDSEGGYLVPADVNNQIIAKRDEMALMSRLGATVYQTDRDVFDFPAEDGSMSAFTIVAEEGAITEGQDEPTFAAPQAVLYKFDKLVKLSEELDEDYNTGLASFLTNAFGRAWAITENTYVQTGTGSSQPQGAFVGGTAALTLDSASAIGPGEIPELIGKLQTVYRDRAVMVMNRTTGAYLAGLTGNQFVFRQAPAAQAWANGDDLGIGYPVILTEGAAEIAASAKTLLFGNFDFYGWVRNRSIRMMRFNELYRGNGQIGIRAYFRAGGIVQQAEAFQYATHPTA